MHADGPRAVGPHGKPVEASAGTTASDVGAMRETFLQYLNSTWLLGELVPCVPKLKVTSRCGAREGDTDCNALSVLSQGRVLRGRRPTDLSCTWYGLSKSVLALCVKLRSWPGTAHNRCASATSAVRPIGPDSALRALSLASKAAPRLETLQMLWHHPAAPPDRHQQSPSRETRSDWHQRCQRQC